jgi:hypothetical protein
MAQECSTPALIADTPLVSPKTWTAVEELLVD